MFKIIISVGLLTANSMSFASEIGQVFSNVDMEQQDNRYELVLYPKQFESAAVVDLKLDVQGNGELMSQMQPVCTQWQENTCTGSYKDILHNEFLHEVDVALYCDDELLYQERKNNSEFTNEEISSLSSHLSFNKSLVKTNSLSCNEVKLTIQTMHGDNDANIQGRINLLNSTSGLSNENYELLK
ncbi:hypothetical protein H5119_05235 [Pseudoalteromonas sp. SG45-5]|uniref:hypothetical protein n=1 Tax=unclassified Pseudoalteromonas TaxID=194690 RepID=UPI0015F7F4FE|nr:MULTISPECIES: hypothetical protein [unclassified Pseudoalteromonas]MBB1384954.1 hypothetical protein [Pseudoalteromonas sp. SG45-5]MBB1392868.1 hypothetical protein [Pseudoalteromonas sp. SG44-4]MBB1446167.1 hypothetical protein [Pseudoalteromonas sp. SG41-6]